jgi:hypothetical protein
MKLENNWLWAIGDKMIGLTTELENREMATDAKGNDLSGRTETMRNLIVFSAAYLSG